MTEAAKPTGGEWFVECGPGTAVVVWSRVSGDSGDDKHVVAVPGYPDGKAAS